MKRSYVAAATLLGMPAASLLASVIYVNAAATGANNGSSWTDAYVSLQSGLAAGGSGDEIWVAAAMYKPTATADRTISFALKNGVGAYGGFNGTETLRSQRNPAVNVTILSGDIGTPGTASDNSYHVATADVTVTSSGVLDGFTVTAGQADGANPNERGGGMWDNGGAPTLGNLIFSGNFANFEGGGLRVTSGAPTLTHCTFTGNTVAFGGAGAGMKAGGGSSVTATSCVFRSNQISGASVGAGGVESGGGMTLVNCVLAQNNPSGIHFIGDGNTLENCTIAGNSAYGAAYLVSNGNSMTNTIVWANNVAGVFNDGSSSVSVAYCDTQDGIGGTGNIDADPLFRGYPADLRLGSPSPAVDAGNNAAVPGGVTTDLSGLPRFFDDPAVPDTGAGTHGCLRARTALRDLAFRPLDLFRRRRFLQRHGGGSADPHLSVAQGRRSPLGRRPRLRFDGRDTHDLGYRSRRLGKLRRRGHRRGRSVDHLHGGHADGQRPAGPARDRRAGFRSGRVHWEFGQCDAPRRIDLRLDAHGRRDHGRARLEPDHV